MVFRINALSLMISTLILGGCFIMESPGGPFELTEVSATAVTGPAIELSWALTGDRDGVRFDVTRALSVGSVPVTGTWRTILRNGNELTGTMDTTVRGGTSYLYAVTAYRDQTTDTVRVQADADSSDSFLWRYQPQSVVDLTFEIGNPTIADLGDGKGAAVLVGIDRTLVCIDGEDGTLRWSVEVGRPVLSGDVASPILATPAVADINNDGTADVLFGARDRYFYAINGADGSTLWSREFGGELRTSPTVIPRKGGWAIFFGSNDKKVHYLNATDGTLLWTRPVAGRVQQTAAAADPDANGEYTAYVGVRQGRFYAFDLPTSAITWEKDLGETLTGAPAVVDLDGDGIPEIVVASGSGRIFAYRHTGTLFWQAVIGAKARFAVAIADADGDGDPDVLTGLEFVAEPIIIDGQSGAVVAEGDSWPAITASPLVGTLHPDDGRVLLLGSTAFSIPALQPVWAFRAAENIGHGAMGDLDADGSLDYVWQERDGTVYAINWSAAGDAPWPQAHHDARNSGMFTKSGAAPW